jgi:hypothetical protein
VSNLRRLCVAKMLDASYFFVFLKAKNIIILYMEIEKT